MAGKHITVAEYLTQQIDLSSKSQLKIANDLGYEKHNIITMFKQGKTGVPINKVPALARTLGLDPLHLLRLCMSEYMPSAWATIEEVVGSAMLSDNEAMILDIVRKGAGAFDVAPSTPAEKAELAALVAKWRKNAEKQGTTHLRTKKVTR